MTTLKTVSMYLRAAKTEAEDAGESTEGMASSVSELREELLKLTNGKVDIQLDENTFKSTYQILKELSEVWDGLTDITQASNSSTTRKPSSSKKSSSKSNSSSKSSDDKDDSEIIDWIEIAIDRIERAIDRLATVATSPFRKLAERISATNDELSQMSYELSLQQSAYDRYMQQASSVGLSSDLASKVQNGTIDITEYDGDTADKIKDYQEWYVKCPPIW